VKNVAVNKTVPHDYIILETLEAGLALVGSEVKSVRDGRISLKECYAEVRNGEAFLVKCQIGRAHV
jgi:SsrA-binding protein